MATHSYLVVEGPHDVALIGRLLRLSGLNLVRQLAALDQFWVSLVPKTFPHTGDLLKRMPVPVFYADADRSVAVHAAQGDSRIVETVQESLVSLPGQLDAIGLVLDADDQRPPEARFQDVRGRLSKVGVEAGTRPGEVSLTASLRSGIYVLPDNEHAGTLENVLIDCAAVSYADLLDAARAYVANATPALEQMPRDDRKEFQKPAGTRKATVAAIAGLLRPGKAVQTSIEDNRWLNSQTLALPVVAGIHAFLRELLAVP